MRARLIFLRLIKRTASIFQRHISFLKNGAYLLPGFTQPVIQPLTPQDDLRSTENISPYIQAETNIERKIITALICQLIMYQLINRVKNGKENGISHCTMPTDIKIHGLLLTTKIQQVESLMQRWLICSAWFHPLLIILNFNDDDSSIII